MGKVTVLSPIKSKEGKRKKINSIITLRPYKNHLLSSQARRWTVGAAILIFLIAITESVIWGNVANLYFQEIIQNPVYRLLFCGFVSIVIFFFIWIIDSSFIVMDMTRNPTDKKSIWNLFTKKWAIQILGFSVRLLIMGICLYVTIPAITKITLSKDIDNEISNINSRKINSIIDSVQGEFNEKIKGKEKLIEERNKDLINEIGGTKGQGYSGKYGDKSVAKAIRTHMKELGIQKDILKKESLDKTNEIMKTPLKELTRLYGIEFVDKTVKSIDEISSNLEKNQNGNQLEKLSRAYVVILFVALLIMKMFSPRSITIYFNEELQDLYTHYLNGQIHENYLVDLQTIMKDVKSKMVTPYTFEDYWISYVKKRKRDLDLIKHDSRLKKLADQIVKLNSQIIEVKNELDNRQRDYNELHVQMTAVAFEYIEKNRRFQKLLNDKREMEAELNSLNATNAEISAMDMIRVAEKRKNISITLSTLQDQLEPVIGEMEVIMKNKSEIEETLNKLRAKMVESEGEIQRFEDKKRKLRGEFLDDFGDEMYIA
jgi:hypothetical protein